MAAQLKASVEQLDMLTLGAHEIKNSIQEHKWPETDVKVSICQFFEQLFSEKIIPSELYPKDMSRFSENLFSLLRNRFIKMNHKKWNKELSLILSKIKLHFNLFLQNDFPMSLSLYQLCYGIMMKENFIYQYDLKNIPFHKSDIFDIIFPESKDMKIKEFKNKYGW